MVYRVFVEKKPAFAIEANNLLHELNDLLGLPVKTLRMINRYDAEGLTEELFSYAVKTVFSEPQTDEVSEDLKLNAGETCFAVEYLPGQFDQRADSAASCIALISQKQRPLVRTAKVYVLTGDVTPEVLAKVKHYVINKVEAREASLEKPASLALAVKQPEKVKTLTGFRALDKAGLAAFVKQYALAMDEDDAAFCRAYFEKEGRDPTLTEIRMLDTYWSDHCRHTTFLTTIDRVETSSGLLQNAYDRYLTMREEMKRTKPVNLMDVATTGVRYLKKQGLLEKLDESEEINACTVKIEVTVDGKKEDWLLLFKNETHNHPTEIEPFGGAATCIGGAIRDPLSGRSYVYAAMRVTGAGNPLTPVEDTLPGKLPQRKIVQTAAAGYSSYGNQIGLATGIVDELYDEGYVAKRMEIGAVIAAAPKENVVRETPLPGDAVILIGGRTGRDGCGGATGSSKSHTAASIDTCGAEVQKGNAPEERKLQRLFRNPAFTKKVKRCNDFGAGGVSVAIGELADGLKIDLGRVPKKYEGLDGTELAISESQERMAVVVRKEDVAAVLRLAEEENLEATEVAVVTESPRLVMTWNGDVVVDVSREFLNSNGAEKHTTAVMEAPEDYQKPAVTDFKKGYLELVSDLNVCSKQGLSERFDSTIGKGTVLMPFGGKYQATPIQAMVHKISTEAGDTEDVSFMSWGYNPQITKKSPFHGAYLAVIESVSKLIATGADFKDVYLTFQEYFEKPMNDSARWGKPLAALLGALKAQDDLKIASIGGKDSMSGTFEHIDVPPTLVSFAVTTGKISDVCTNHFKLPGSKVSLLKVDPDENGLFDPEKLIALYHKVAALIRDGKVLSCYTPGFGGVAEAVFKMAIGNRLGFTFDKNLKNDELFGYNYAAFVVESAGGEVYGTLLGETTYLAEFTKGGEKIALSDLLSAYEGKLEPVYRRKVDQNIGKIPEIKYVSEEKYKAKTSVAKPRVLIPVFPGTNCEYDSQKAVEAAGAKAEIFVVNNLSPENIKESARKLSEKIRSSQAIFIPGGFSGGDEPDGSGKFITAFFRNAEMKDAVSDLLQRREGLMLGICNGFQALVKLGLVPFGEIRDPDENAPTLTYNKIARHQSRIVRVKAVSGRSPWMLKVKPGDVFAVPVSHGEGRFVASPEMLKSLAENGQIATQYVDYAGNPTYDIDFNPNGSDMAVEGIFSPDGRVFGKMGHAERVGVGLYQNYDGNFDMKLFESLVEYYK